MKSEDDPLDPHPPKAFRRTLERLSPEQRAVYPLHDVFDYS